ncbi:MAG TPA: HD family phosphohydrolase, partial [Thermodesulfobacteriota bacterium]|nr:HD family phosphohydrolase [Thermodesulfobacteriota bacterium]
MNADTPNPIHDFIRHTLTAVSNVALYSGDHPLVAELCSQGLARLMEAMGGETSLSLMVIDEEIILAGIPLGNSLHVKRFARLLSSLGVGSVRISRDVDAGELQAFASGLAKKGNGQKTLASSRNIRLGKVEVRCLEAADRDV